MPAHGPLGQRACRDCSFYQVELLAHGDTIFDILDGQAREDVHKKLLLAQEQPGRGKARENRSAVCSLRSPGWDLSPALALCG